MTRHTPHPQPELPQGFDVLASIRRLIAQDKGQIQSNCKAIHPPIAPYVRVHTPEDVAVAPIDDREPRLLLDRADLIERIRLSPRLHLGQAAKDAMQITPAEHAEAESLNDPGLAEQVDMAAESCGSASAATSSEQGETDTCKDMPGLHEPEPAGPETQADVGELPPCDLAQGDFGLGSEQEEFPPAPAPRAQPLPPAPPAAADDHTPSRSDRSQAITRAITRPSVNRPSHAHTNSVRRDFGEDMNLHLFAPTDNDLPNGSVLRNLIREVIRQELHGEMGGRFSRNLRTVIRQEVAAALEVQVMPIVRDSHRDTLQQ